MKPKLLLVDDDHSVRESLQKLLLAEHYDVYPAYDAIGAIEHFKANRIDLVILDINLGRDNGWQVFETMTAINPFVPTIIITAEWGQQERAVTLGVEGLIEKPIDVPVFLKMIRDLLAETTEERLNRICGDDEYCRYVAGHYEPYLRKLLERYNTPFKLSPRGQHPWFNSAVSSTHVDAQHATDSLPAFPKTNDAYENDPMDSEKAAPPKLRLKCRSG